MSEPTAIPPRLNSPLVRAALHRCKTPVEYYRLVIGLVAQEAWMERQEARSEQQKQTSEKAH